MMRLSAMSHCKKCITPRVTADPASVGRSWQLIKGEISWAGSNQIIIILIQHTDLDQARVLNTSQTYFICLQYSCPFSKGFIPIPDFSKNILAQETDNYRKKSNEGASQMHWELFTLTRPFTARQCCNHYRSICCCSNKWDIYLLYTHSPWVTITMKNVFC